MQSVNEQTDFTLKRSFNSSEKKKNSNVAKATIYAVFWESDLQTNVKVNFWFVATRQILLKDQLANEKRSWVCRKTTGQTRITKSKEVAYEKVHPWILITAPR